MAAMCVVPSAPAAAPAAEAAMLAPAGVMPRRFGSPGGGASAIARSMRMSAARSRA
jgi:hypothetical protein